MTKRMVAGEHLMTCTTSRCSMHLEKGTSRRMAFLPKRPKTQRQGNLLRQHTCGTYPSWKAAAGSRQWNL
eukprot:1249228-Amphidinium_carterae.1